MRLFCLSAAVLFIGMATPAAAQAVQVRTDDYDRVVECLAGMNYLRQEAERRRQAPIDGIEPLINSWLDKAIEIMERRGISNEVLLNDIRDEMRHHSAGSAAGMWSSCRDGT
jgi:hypothetical protein